MANCAANKLNISVIFFIGFQKNVQRYGFFGVCTITNEAQNIFPYFCRIVIEFVEIWKNKYY